MRRNKLRGSDIHIKGLPELLVAGQHFVAGRLGGGADGVEQGSDGAGDGDNVIRIGVDLAVGQQGNRGIGDQGGGFGVGDDDGGDLPLPNKLNDLGGGLQVPGQADGQEDVAFGNGGEGVQLLGVAVDDHHVVPDPA